MKTETNVMRQSLNTGNSLLIDAGIAVWAVLPIESPIDTLQLIEHWRRKGIRLLAPGLFLSESNSAIRRLVYGGMITADEGEIALNDLLELEIKIIHETEQHCRSASRWARQLDQSKAYDGFYLAVAEQTGSPFWTADRRLANSALTAKVDWVHWVGDYETT
jgi:predicted nucleic acid-binding protein